MQNNRVVTPLKGKFLRNSLLISSLALALLGFLFTGIGSAHAATEPSTILRISYNGTGSVVPVQVHHRSAQPPQIPHRLPGTLYCLYVPLSVVNDSPGHLQVTVGVTNNCPVDVTNTNWEYSGTVTCLGQSRPIPFRSGSFGTLRKSGMYTLTSAGYAVVCLLDGVPQVWRAQVNATVDGDISYGSYDLAAGSNVGATEGL